MRARIPVGPIGRECMRFRSRGSSGHLGPRAALAAWRSSRIRHRDFPSCYINNHLQQRMKPLAAERAWAGSERRRARSRMATHRRLTVRIRPMRRTLAQCGAPKLRRSGPMRVPPRGFLPEQNGRGSARLAQDTGGTGWDRTRSGPQLVQEQHDQRGDCEHARAMKGTLCRRPS